MKFSRNPVDGKLAELRVEAEERDAKRRAAAEGIPYFTGGMSIDKKVFRIIPEKDIRSARAAISQDDDGTLTVVVYSSKLPGTVALLQSLKEKGLKIKIFLASSARIKGVWDRYDKKEINVAENREQIVSEIALNNKGLEEIKTKAKNVSEAGVLFQSITGDTPTSAAVSLILSTALAFGASDVHIEHLTKSEAILRFRIDGVLKDISKLSPEIARQVVSRLKLLSKLKLNITDAPQDGRFTITSEWGDVEVRISVVPAEFGEAVVLRVLDPRDIGLELSELGLRPDTEEIILEELKRPNGMILVTGPTGSGKTTSLYAFLKKTKKPELKIITIEDPIEYHLEGIEQTQTEPESGYTFATGLRSILRQDPDIILVGEIRDLETAEIGIHAALTGHLVFSTLHTNNAAGAIPRLIDLGVKPSVIGAALTLIIAQRLVRKLCEECKEEVEIDDEIGKKISKFLEDLPKHISHESIEVKLYRAVGCDECPDGFMGRIAVMELLRVGDDMEVLIRKKATEGEIERVAVKKQGMVRMQEDGILKALQGITTLEEVERATGPISW